MYNKKPSIDYSTYGNDMYKLLNLINRKDFDCIVCLKRSGFMLGAFLSNQFTLPLFTVSEIPSIPNKFTRILVVDDKICTGKSLNKVIKKLPLLINITTATMYVEGSKYPDIYAVDLKSQFRMWYEKD